MTQIRCPRRACRRRCYDVVPGAFLITTDGAVVYPPSAQSTRHMSLSWGRVKTTAVQEVAVQCSWDAYRAVPPHFRCNCGHRWTLCGDRNTTLRVGDDERVFDAFEVAALLQGKAGGWNPSHNYRLDIGNSGG